MLQVLFQWGISVADQFQATDEDDEGILDWKHGMYTMHF